MHATLSWKYGEVGVRDTSGLRQGQKVAVFNALVAFVAGKVSVPWSCFLFLAILPGRMERE